MRVANQEAVDRYSFTYHEAIVGIAYLISNVSAGLIFKFSFVLIGFV